MRISIVLPFPVTKPVGGAKIMYEYANRLAEEGNKIVIYHAIKRPFKKSSTPVILKQLIFKLRGVARPKWFALHPGIQSVIVPSISNKYLQNADAVISTWWQMTYALNDLAMEKGKKFNLIQDYEIWKGQEDLVHESYHLPLNHLVIAKYLQQLVMEKTGNKPGILPNAIDTNRFMMVKPPAERASGKIMMLYSEEPRKDSSLGLQALHKLYEQVPSLEVILFGVYPEPQGLPHWITYHQRPTNLVELYNEAAIFFSPSLGEGWALPPAEAMACGCAVVCTDIGGHADYAINKETALLTVPGNAEDMADKLKTLINDKELRCELATASNKLIGASFSWKNSVQKLISYMQVADR